MISHVVIFYIIQSQSELLLGIQQWHSLLQQGYLIALDSTKLPPPPHLLSQSCTLTCTLALSLSACLSLSVSVSPSFCLCLSVCLSVSPSLLLRSPILTHKSSQQIVQNTYTKTYTCVYTHMYYIHVDVTLR